MTDFYHYNVKDKRPTVGTVIVVNMHLYRIIGTEKRAKKKWRVTAELLKFRKDSNKSENSANVN
jgi:hypothetical protein